MHVAIVVYTIAAVEKAFRTFTTYIQIQPDFRQIQRTQTKCKILTFRNFFAKLVYNIPYPAYQPLIRRQPLDRAESLAGQPCCSFMFIEMHRLRNQRTDEAMHLQMEIRIIPLNGLQQFPDLNLRVEFLPNLPNKRLLRAFPWLNLASGKLPPALPLAIPALRGENLSVPDYYRRNNFYRLHIMKPYEQNTITPGTKFQGRNSLL